MKIPFDIKFRPQIESGEYNEHVELYPESGTTYAKAPTEHDLFLVTPEPEPSEFEKELATVIGFAISQSVVAPDTQMVNFVKDWSEKLLAIARKELRDEIEFRGEEYQTGYKEGQADLLKDFPRWKKIKKNEHLPCEAFIRVGNYGGYMPCAEGVEMGNDGYYLPSQKIDELPKED